MESNPAVVATTIGESGNSDSAPLQRLKPTKKFQRIDIAARMEILRHHADGLNALQISKITGLAHQRVGEILKLVGPYKEQARGVLDQFASRAASAWVTSIPKAAKKGDHRPARDLLIATGVISPTESTSSGVTVVVNMPQESPRSVGSATTLEGVFVMPEDAE